MLKIALFGILTAMLAVFLKGMKAEYAVWLVLASGIFLGSQILLKLQTLVEEIQILEEVLSSYGTYLTILVKIIGIAYLSEFASGLCRDAGYQSIAVSIEMFAKLTILVLCIPILTALLETVRFFLGGS
ncbi:MAG: SpoIIIAC/SpoIIIAD family protein [Lachnospiraceae bacterium]